MKKLLEQNRVDIPPIERWLFYISLTLNVCLLLAFWYEKSQPRRVEVSIPPPPIVTNVVKIVNVEQAQPRYIEWSQLQGRSLHELIANLRSIGFPESVIKVIIISLVEEQFFQLSLQKIPRPEYQWWRQEVDPQLQVQIQEATSIIEGEKNRLLTELLGPNWNQPELRVRQELERPLEGPILGELSSEIKTQVREIERRYLDEQADIKKWIELERALSAILTPQQLEEYLLRYSPVAKILREKTRNHPLSSQQFRDLFRQIMKVIIENGESMVLSVDEILDSTYISSDVIDRK